MDTHEIDQYWLASIYTELLDIVPRSDGREHDLGDECWCYPKVTKPICGNCRQEHMPIVVHNSAKKCTITGRDAYRDIMIRTIEQR